MQRLDLYRGNPVRGRASQDELQLPRAPDAALRVAGRAVAASCLLLWQRKYTRFRGQVFFLFVFGYGFLRFLLELWRDDTERGAYGPTLDAHVYIPLCLLLMGIGFAFGISLGIVNTRARLVARVLAFVPPVVAYLLMRARDVCADDSLPALDQPDHRPAERPRRVVLLRPLLGAGAQEPDARHEPGRHGHHPRAPGRRRRRRGRGRGRGGRGRGRRGCEAPEARRPDGAQGKKKGLAAEPKAVEDEVEADDAPKGKGDPEPEGT